MTKNITSTGFAPEEDRLLLSLRADGLRWYEIADRLSWSSQACQRRHGELTAIPAAPAGEQPARPIAARPKIEETDPEVLAASAAADGSARLLRAQIRAGQVFGRQREEWLARHGAAA